MDIIFVGKAASCGALRAFGRLERELSERYSQNYLRAGVRALEEGENFDFDKLQELLAKNCGLIYPIREQGFFEALWSLGEALESGLRVRLSEVPISRFAIELAEYLDENPYLWDSTGCLLAVSSEGGRLKELLEEEGIPCSIIGWLSDDKARCIIGSAGLTYLTPKERAQD